MADSVGQRMDFEPHIIAIRPNKHVSVVREAAVQV